MKYIWTKWTTSNLTTRRRKQNAVLYFPPIFCLLHFHVKLRALFTVNNSWYFYNLTFSAFFLVLNFFWGPSQIVLDSTLEFLYSFQLYIILSVLNDKTYLRASLNFAANIRRIQKNRLISIPPKISRRPMVTYGYRLSKHIISMFDDNYNFFKKNCQIFNNFFSHYFIIFFLNLLFISVKLQTSLQNQFYIFA